MAQAQIRSLLSQESQSEDPQKAAVPPASVPAKKRKKPQVETTTTKKARQSSLTIVPPTPSLPNCGFINDFLFFDLYFDMFIAPSLSCTGPAMASAPGSSPLASNSTLLTLYRTLFKHQLFSSFIQRLNSSLEITNNSVAPASITHTILFNSFLDAAHSLGLQFN